MQFFECVFDSESVTVTLVMCAMQYNMLQEQ